jgi:hypothetical protein
MADCEILSLNDAAKWTQLLNKLPVEQQDIYFTPEYYSLYENFGDGKACCFVFKDNGRLALYPFLLNTINALGYTLANEYYDIQGAYGYNGVITTSYEHDFIEKFYHTFNSYCEKNRIVAEFIRFHPLLNNKVFSENDMVLFFDRKTVFINLNDSYEDIFKHFQITTRKQIKRCNHKYGLTVEIYENDSSKLPVFYDIYIETMARVNSNPYLYFNEDYFKELLEKNP